MKLELMLCNSLLDKLESILWHIKDTSTIGLCALWNKHDWSVLDVSSISDSLEALVKVSTSDSGWWPNAHGLFENLKSAHSSKPCLSSSIIIVHPDEDWAVRLE